MGGCIAKQLQQLSLFERQVVAGAVRSQQARLNKEPPGVTTPLSSTFPWGSTSAVPWAPSKCAWMLHAWVMWQCMPEEHEHAI